MDPLTVATGAKAAGAMLGLAKSSVDLSVKIRLLFANSDSWIRLEGSYADFPLADIDDITSCVASSTFAPLMQVAWITSLTSGKGAAREFEEHFNHAAEIWCARSGRRWNRHSRSIWFALVDRIDSTIPRSTAFTKSRSDKGVADLMLTLLADKQADSRLRVRLTKLAADLSLLERSHQFAEQLGRLNSGSTAIVFVAPPYR